MYRFYVSLKTLISFHQPEVLLFNFLQNFFSNSDPFECHLNILSNFFL